MPEIRSDIGRYGIIPEWLLDTGINSTALRLYLILAAKYADCGNGRAWPSRQQLAFDLRVASVRTVDAAIKALESIGAAQVERGRCAEDGDPETNIYILHFSKPSERVEPRRPQVVDGQDDLPAVVAQKIALPPANTQHDSDESQHSESPCSRSLKHESFKPEGGDLRAEDLRERSRKREEKSEGKGETCEKQESLPFAQRPDDEMPAFDWLTTLREIEGYPVSAERDKLFKAKVLKDGYDNDELETTALAMKASFIPGIKEGRPMWRFGSKIYVDLRATFLNWVRSSRRRASLRRGDGTTQRYLDADVEAAWEADARWLRAKSTIDLRRATDERRLGRETEDGDSQQPPLPTL